MSSVDRRWRSRDGLWLHAHDHAAAGGEARLPVICLHGLTRNARDFERLAPWLAARGRRTIAIDIRGRGESDWDPAADYRVPTYVDDVARLFAAAGIARALFVGTSMGGIITMALAATRPDLIAAAVINDIGPDLAPAGLARIAAYVGQAASFPDWQAAADHLRAQNRHALPHYRERDWLTMAWRMCRERDGCVRPDYDPAIALPFRDAPTTDDPWSHWRALARERPILLLRGSRSDLLTRDTADRMVAAGDRVDQVEVPDVGHAPMLDEPAALAAIEGFLAGQP